MNESDLNALAQAFGETRRIKRTETRRGLGVIVMVVSIVLPCPPFSVLGVSNKCNDLNANA